jgi:hypothetical protein
MSGKRSAAVPGGARRADEVGARIVATGSAWGAERVREAEQ